MTLMTSSVSFSICNKYIRNHPWHFLDRKKMQAKIAEGGFYEVRPILRSLVPVDSGSGPVARAATVSNSTHIP